MLEERVCASDFAMRDVSELHLQAQHLRGLLYALTEFEPHDRRRTNVPGFSATLAPTPWYDRWPACDAPLERLAEIWCAFRCVFLIMVMRRLGAGCERS